MVKLADTLRLGRNFFLSEGSSPSIRKLLF